METAFNFNGKNIALVHNENETSVEFLYNHITHKIEVVGVSNYKKTRQIQIEVVYTKKDNEGNFLVNERPDYLITNELEYSMFYNIGTVVDKGLGFTEYMHALNGATFRNALLQERFFNADGSLKTY